MNVQSVNPKNELEKQIAQLTKNVHMLATSKTEAVHEVGQAQCQLCGEFGHTAAACHGLNDATQCEQANWVGSNNPGYNQRGSYDVNSNFYNPALRNHPNLSWRSKNYMQQGNRQNQSFPPYQPLRPTHQQPPQQNIQPYHPPQNQFNAQGLQKGQSSNGTSIEDTLHSFMKSVNKMKNENEKKFENINSSLRRLEIQVGQVAESSKKHVMGKLPSHVEHAKAAHVLRSGKTVDNKIVDRPEEYEQRNAGEGTKKQLDDDREIRVTEERQARRKGIMHEATAGRFKSPELSQLPYPQRMVQSKKDKQFS